ncbi:MAG: NADPH-dependent oxidoreductase [Planctomycetes bacterium]|nr:NADPH-dependent oxidoreductase [Planctomycetota bacterium]
MNDVLRTMAAHRTVRAYLPDPVPDEHLRAAVEAARCAPTSSWIQAYSLLNVTDPGERGRLAELTGGQPQVAQAGAFLVVCGDARRHRLVAERLGQPFVANLETFLLAVSDATLFAQNLVLAFESMGYGTCCIGGLRNRLPEVDALLAIPADVFPLFGLCVGRPDPAVETATRPRLPVDAILMRGRYLDDAEMLAQIDAFDAEAAAHYAERGLEGRTWTGGLWRKFTRPMRPGLHDYYTAKGARLE